MKRQLLAHILPVRSVSALCPTAGLAQFKAGIEGTVTDMTGAVIPGAKVTLTNLETTRKSETTSSAAGFYRISGMPPGKYKVSVERDGFKRKDIENIELGAEVMTGLDPTLEAGQMTDTVTISADATRELQTENANIDRGITQIEIRRLPQFGRDPYELAATHARRLRPGRASAAAAAVNLPNTTGPGGSNTSIFQVENQSRSAPTASASRPTTFQIDGVSVNSLGWGGAAVVTPNQESVKEVQVTSTSYSAEDGRNSGAQIKVVSQNGTNEFHGSGFFK